MAKKKRRSNSDQAQSPIGPTSDRISSDVSTAENGFIVSISGETGGKKPSYFSKRFVATTRPQAMRIAASHLSGTAKSKRGGKKAAKKKFTAK